MKIEIGENREVIIKEVFSSIILESGDKEIMSICMRDSGFEFVYEGEFYEAKEGVIKKLTKNEFEETEDIFSKHKNSSFFCKEYYELTEYQEEILKRLKSMFPSSVIEIIRGDRLVVDGEIVKGFLAFDIRKRKDYDEDIKVFSYEIKRQVLGKRESY
jgi:hypothetical protein